MKVRLNMIRQNLMIRVQSPKDIKKWLEIFSKTQNPLIKELLEFYDENRSI